MTAHSSSRERPHGMADDRMVMILPSQGSIKVDNVCLLDRKSSNPWYLTLSVSSSIIYSARSCEIVLYTMTILESSVVPWCSCALYIYVSLIIAALSGQMQTSLCGKHVFYYMMKWVCVCVCVYICMHVLSRYDLISFCKELSWKAPMEASNSNKRRNRKNFDCWHEK